MRTPDDDCAPAPLPAAPAGPALEGAACAAPAAPPADCGPFAAVPPLAASAPLLRSAPCAAAAAPAPFAPAAASPACCGCLLNGTGAFATPSASFARFALFASSAAASAALFAPAPPPPPSAACVAPSACWGTRPSAAARSRAAFPNLSDFLGPAPSPFGWGSPFEAAAGCASVAGPSAAEALRLVLRKDARALPSAVASDARTKTRWTTNGAPKAKAVSLTQAGQRRHSPGQRLRTASPAARASRRLPGPGSAPPALSASAESGGGRYDGQEGKESDRSSFCMPSRMHAEQTRQTGTEAQAWSGEKNSSFAPSEAEAPVAALAAPQPLSLWRASEPALARPVLQPADRG